MPPRAPKRNALLVLGMHRSGTSLVTRLINLLGADIGQDLVSPAIDNPKGFWELCGVAEAHDKLLGDLGGAWHDAMPLPAGWPDTEAAQACRGRIRDLLGSQLKSEEPLWCIKDPRMCRLVPLWLRILNDMDREPSFVIIVRHPLEVAASLGRRNDLSVEHAVLLYLRHYAEALMATNDCRRVFVTLDQVMNDPVGVLSHICRQLDLTWPNAPEELRSAVETSVDASLRHFAPGHEPGSIDLATDLYKAIEEAAATDAPGRRIRKIKSIVRRFQGASELFDHYTRLKQQEVKSGHDAYLARRDRQEAELRTHVKDTMARCDEKERRLQAAEIRHEELEQSLQAAVERHEELERDTEAAVARHDDAERRLEEREAAFGIERNELRNALASLGTELQHRTTTLEDTHRERDEFEVRCVSLDAQVKRAEETVATVEQHLHGILSSRMYRYTRVPRRIWTRLWAWQ